MNTLSITVTAGEGGPVITLAGEADVSNALQLMDVISAQIASGATYLTVDAGGLSFADSRAVSTLAAAGTTLKTLGGRLVVLRPQEAVLRVMTLLGIDEVVTIQTSPGTVHPPKDDAGDSL